MEQTIDQAAYQPVSRVSVRSRDRLVAWRAGLLVFTASCATLILELVAGRMLSPFIGVSLITWTSVIGVVLAGISVGNWLGGKIADRYPTPRTAGVLFLLGGLNSLLTLGMVALLGDGLVLRPVPLLARTFLLTLVVFFPPSLILGAVTPVVIKLTLPDVAHTGRIVGLIYALGTFGSLVGNFLTGFVLVAYLPITIIVSIVGAVLLAVAALAGEWWRPRGLTVVAKDNSDPAAAATGPNAPLASGNGGHIGLFHLPGNVRLACTVVAIASFCSMAIELAASRILAPYIGVSLYSWTGIIGVVLAGIAVGNYLGGRIADRWPRQGFLGFSLFLCGLASLSIVVSVMYVAQQGLFNSLGLMERIVAMTAAIFFVPVLLLGTISPQVIRLAIADLDHAGRISGRVYAWSTAGAIAGTFATGWFLISLLGVHTLILAAGLGLVGLAIFAGRFWRDAINLIGAVAIAAGAVYVLFDLGALKSVCTLETDYFCIKVYDEVRDVGPVKTLVLDHLIHSYVKIGDPSYLGYEHEQVQAELTRLVAARTSAPRVLVVGGGGYTYPRWVEAFVPSASVDVVEIDPGVTETAYRELGLSRDTRIISHNLDGRQFVQELAPRGAYQLIVQDAVNDLSVPYHILTKEYNDHIRALLSDDGIYLLTVIDLYRDGQLLRAAARTMMETFPEVQLMGVRPAWEYAGSSVFVMYGSARKFDAEELQMALRSRGVEMRTVAQPKEQLRAYVDVEPRIVLTDQYAPVDNLISILFRSRN
ncbi:MAG: fused MFS/spermidine synthase [Chloroflexi bacterium]|nr:fused MFS/spermidine synthase [Chloroflexota bacterium]